jgi:hypothetical protein
LTCQSRTCIWEELEGPMARGGRTPFQPSSFDQGETARCMFRARSSRAGTTALHNTEPALPAWVILVRGPTAGSREVARRQLELSAHRSRLPLRTARRARRSCRQTRRTATCPSRRRLTPIRAPSRGGSGQGRNHLRRVPLTVQSDKDASGPGPPRDAHSRPLLPRPSPEFRRRAWMLFQRTLDPFARPKPLPRSIRRPRS